MKKLIALISVITSVLVIGGCVTYALVTKSDKATNVFTSGNVKIELNEKYINKPKVIMPCSFFTREITVKNTGNKDCYVMLVIGDKFKDQTEDVKDAFDMHTAKLYMIEYAVSPHSQGDKWIGDKDTIYYSEPLKAGETTEPIYVSDNFNSEIKQEIKLESFACKCDAFAVQSDNNPVSDGKTVADIKTWPKKN